MTKPCRYITPILPLDLMREPNPPIYSRESCLEHDDYGQEIPKERSLWQSVVLQAIFDATCPGTNAFSRRNKTQSIIWFSRQNKDFMLVCEMAGIEPSSTISHIKKLIKQSATTNRRKSRMQQLRRNKARIKDNVILRPAKSAHK